MKVNVGNDLYLKGRIGWKGLAKNEYLEKGDYRIINGYSLKDGYIDWDIAGYISEDRYLESPEIMLKVNDILISKDGTIGKVGIVRSLVSPTTVASGIFVLRNIIEDKLDTEYLFQYLKSSNFKAFINAVKSSGSTIIHLYQRDLAKLEIDVPRYDIQKSISSLLFFLDSKIELNNKINTELEALAKTIYDYWFVQFNFPNAKGKPYKTSGGKMVWNEDLKREIPEGWVSGELKDIANITMGQSPPGESYNEVGEGMIFYQGCTDFGNRFPTIRKYTTEPTRFAKEGDILLSVRAPVGTMNIAKEDCCIGRGLAALNSKDNCIAYLFGVMVNLKQIFDRRNVDGTTFGSITKDDLFSLNVVKPTKEILKQFNEILNPVFQKQNKLELENIQLASLRDWLLPMLMNGQVNVGDAKNSDSYRKVEEKLSMAAEEKGVYSKSERIKLPIPQTKKSFAKQVLAGKIVSLLREDENFTDIKFQKLQYLAEHIANADLDWNYYRKMAGPYDNKFMHTVATKLKTNKWFEDRKQKFKPLAKANDIDKYYQTYFSPVDSKLTKLFNSLKNASEAHSEVIATVYAVWNNLIIKKETVTDDKIVKLFLEWSTRKETYNKKQITDTIKWIKEKGFEPTGFGYLIKELNTK